MKKYMKLIIPLLFVIFTGYILAGNIVIALNGVTYTKSATTIDTSSTLTLSYAKFVDLATYLTGSTSSTVTINIQGKVAGQWVDIYNTGASASFTKGFITLRREADTNSLRGVEQVRTITTIVNSADSTTLLKAYQQLLLR